MPRTGELLACDVSDPTAPTPFIPRTVIAFELDRAQGVTLDVLDLRGRRVARLAAGRWRRACP